MEKIDRIINIVRNLREEMSGMTTGSSGPNAGFSGAADPKGPVAGYDKVLKKYIYGGRGSRSRWMLRRELPKNK